MSKDHLPESTAEPLGPSNSSLQTRLHTVGSLAYAIGHVAINTQVNRVTRVALAANISLAIIYLTHRTRVLESARSTRHRGVSPGISRSIRRARRAGDRTHDDYFFAKNVSFSALRNLRQVFALTAVSRSAGSKYFAPSTLGLTPQALC